jgi:hypothetical protein
LRGFVRDLLFTQARGRVGSSEQFLVWQSAANALRNNPGAQVEIADPSPPPAQRADGLAPASPRVPVVAAAFERMEKARAEQAQAEPPPEAAA